MALDAFFTWLAEFFDGQFLAIIIATGVLFLLMFITWWVYWTLSRRDIFRLHQKHGEMTYASTGDHIIYILKYFFVFPLITFAGFLIFALSLFLLSKPTGAEQETTIIFLAIVIVSTIRISAYVNEHLAEDLGKLIPLTMLSIILLHPSLTGIGITWEQLNAFFTLIPSFVKYLVFTIILEGVLRGGTWLIGGMNREENEEE